MPRRDRASARTSASAQGADRVSAMLAELTAGGLKLTPQRIAIVRELAGDTTHPTAQELYERLLPGMPTMSFATVYNTLDALVARGLCTARAMSPGPTRFDPNVSPHHHAVCDRCGCVVDISCGLPHESASKIPRLLGEAAREAHQRNGSTEPGNSAHEGASPSTSPPSLGGFAVRAVETIFRGLCAGCSSRQS